MRFRFLFFYGRINGSVIPPYPIISKIMNIILSAKSRRRSLFISPNKKRESWKRGLALKDCVREVTQDNFGDRGRCRGILSKESSQDPGSRRDEVPRPTVLPGTYQLVIGRPPRRGCANR
jgi:hypothetical protein